MIFHFQNDRVYGNNRIAGIPINLYEMDLMYDAPCGFYAGPNLQCNLSPYPVDQQNTLNAGAYVLLGFKTGYVLKLKKSTLSVFVEGEKFDGTSITPQRLIRYPTHSLRPTRKSFIRATDAPFTAA